MNGGGLLQEDQCIYDSHAKARRQIHSLKFLKYIPNNRWWANPRLVILTHTSLLEQVENHAFKKEFYTRYLFEKQEILEGTEWFHIDSKWVWVTPLINLESFRTFWDSLLLKQIIVKKFLFGSTVHITGSSKIGVAKHVNLYQEKQWKIGSSCFTINWSVIRYCL